jgi:NAD(P)H-hydrate epimerase
MPAADAHKSSRGRVLVIAGSGAYPGAAVLATRGAMRAGAGYVTLAVPEGIVGIAQAHLLAAPVVGLPQGRSHAFSSAAADKALRLARDFDAVVLGPGLSQADGAAATARELVARLPIPLVIDADALNALVDAHELVARRTAPTVLTPHPGELGRLLGMPTAQVNADRVSSSAKLAGPGCVVVLKGAGTIISVEGRQVVNTSGSAALATAGTGDVLSGIIGALLAQRLDAFDAAALGAYLHGRAGEAAAADLTPMCVTSEDIPGYLSAAVGELLGGW